MDSAENKGRPANDIDDIPIKSDKPKTFEELLEMELAKGGGGGGIVADTPPPAMQA